MRGVLKVMALLVVVLTVAFIATVGVLAVTTPGPREVETWERLADMPVPRGETAVAVAIRTTPEGRFERLVVAGGIAGVGQTVDTVNVYSPEDDAWGRGPSLPEARDHAAAAAIEGTVFVAGGSPGFTTGAQATLWSLRLDEGRWDTRLPMPEPRWGHSMVALDGRLYVIGGRGPTSRVLVFDPEAGWESKAAMPEPRDHLAAVVHDGRIWAIGGRSGGNLTRRVDVYDPGSDSWTPGPALPEPMSAMAAASIPSGIHVVGGEDPGLPGRVIDRHFSLRQGWAAWRAAERPIAAVHGVPGVVVGESMVVAGGSRRQGGLSPLGWTGITQSTA